MKILFNTYIHAFQNPGGGETVLLKTKEALEKKGITVDLFDQWKMKISDYDIMHDFSSINWRYWESFKGCGVKLAVTPVQWPNDSFPKPIEEKTKSIIKNVLGYSSPEVNIWNAMRIPDIFFPTTQMEMDKILNYYELPKNTKYKVIYNGIDSPTKIDLEENSFFKKFQINDYLLYVGRISPLKNVEFIIESALATNSKLVLVGTADITDAEYAKKLKEKYQHKVIFVGALPSQSKILTDAYKGAKALIVASFFETCSLVGLEAGSLGIPVIMTEAGATKEIYQNHVQYINPYQKETLISAIKNISSIGIKDYSLQKYILDNFSWDKVADALITSYLDLLR